MSERVRVEGASVSLGGSRILDGVDATVEPGRFVGLVGPNGAGKTTLLRTVNGSLSPDRGRVLVGGEDVHALSSRATSRLVATVPQDTTLSFDFSVRDAVAMGRTPHRSRFEGWRADDADLVEAAMERVDVAEFADRPVTAVSGGERQRVLLARALAQDAPVVLFDEPTASLDVNHQVRTLELIRELVAEGRTAIAAIHDLGLATRYCDELFLLHDGGVLAAGAPESVLTEASLRRAFDATAVVSDHPVTGSPLVTALPERIGDGSGEATGRVHVIGGGRAATRPIYRLAAAGYDVSVGTVAEGDAAAETARLLDCEAITVPLLSPVGAAARERVREAVAAADVTVLADVDPTEGTRPNLEVTREADRIVAVEGDGTADRADADSPARRTYESLRERATVVSPDELLSAVADTTDARGAVVSSPADDG